MKFTLSADVRPVTDVSPPGLPLSKSVPNIKGQLHYVLRGNKRVREVGPRLRVTLDRGHEPGVGAGVVPEWADVVEEWAHGDARGGVLQDTSQDNVRALFQKQLLGLRARDVAGSVVHIDERAWHIFMDKEADKRAERVAELHQEFKKRWQFQAAKKRLERQMEQEPAPWKPFGGPKAEVYDANKARFFHFILPTLLAPLEVWDHVRNGQERRIYLCAFDRGIPGKSALECYVIAPYVSDKRRRGDGRGWDFYVKTMAPGRQNAARSGKLAWAIWQHGRSGRVTGEILNSVQVARDVRLRKAVAGGAENSVEESAFEDGVYGEECAIGTGATWTDNSPTSPSGSRLRLAELLPSRTLCTAESISPELKKAHASGYPLQDRTTFQGLDISIENRVGSYRVDKQHDPPRWKTLMQCDYGYVKGSCGVDGDHVDVFLGPQPDATHAYIVRQLDPATGAFDEQKVMLGFGSAREAKAKYLCHYDTPKFFGGLTAMAMPKSSSRRWAASIHR
jgi:hypothetical protein